MAPQCLYCRYWQPETGECRINPPVVAGTSELGYTMWPTTKPTDGCSKIYDMRYEYGYHRATIEGREKLFK